RGSRLVVLSDPGMLIDGPGNLRDAPARAVARLLSSNEREQGIYDALFPKDERPLHTIGARLNFLAFGYQRFFSGVEALRFEFGNGQWSTSMLMDSAALSRGAMEDRALWTAVPANAAFCAMLPVDWSRGRELMSVAGADDRTIAGLWQELDGP